jgi:UDP-N-acetylmuramyl pentapeptide phosphotransferase/UDP-N-acetylglucosamine-1-phosphate transferase
MIIKLLILFTLSFLLTLLVRHLALKKNLIDQVNERSSHTIPTPRGGGLAIVLCWFGALVYLFIHKDIEPNLFFALLSGLILAIVSWLDDLMDLKPGVRILAQALSALGALYFLGGIKLLPGFDAQWFFWLTNFIVFVGIIWFINLYNFLDGLDGYASQEAILVSAGLILITGQPQLWLLIAAVAGFLAWNWPKAKIFMGDVGSTQLGFILVVFGIYYHNSGSVAISNWLILTSLFWFDATFTLYRRWRNGEKLSVAHKKHGYQRLVQGGFSHLKVDLWAISLNIVLIGLSYLGQFHLNQSLIILAFVVILLFFINYRIDRIFAFKKDK